MLIKLMCSIISVHCPSPVISVGFRFTHNSVYPSLPPLVLSGTFVSVVQFLSRFTIYLARPECFLHAHHYCIPLYPYVSLRLICTLQHITGLGLILSLHSRDVDLLSYFLIKRVAGKCNPWLHFTPQ